jgi:GNAT superfamily N-acetyltransferase
MNNIRIHSYQPGDLAACRALWAELTQHHGELYQDPSIGGGDPGVYFDRHLAQVGPEHIWVAECQGKVVGFVGLIILDHEAEVEPIVVTKGYRSKGVGQELLKRVIMEAHQLGMRYLNVRPVARNIDAILFFYQAGFQLLGRPEMFMDLKQPTPDPWIPGPEVFGCSFKI